MARYHLNEDGDPGVCKAMVQCPFGDMNADHYESKEEARAAYEKQAVQENLAHRKPQHRKTPFPQRILVGSSFMGGKVIDFDETGFNVLMPHGRVAHQVDSANTSATRAQGTVPVSIDFCPEDAKRIVKHKYDLDTGKFINSDRGETGTAGNKDRSLLYWSIAGGRSSKKLTAVADRWFAGDKLGPGDYAILWDKLHAMKEEEPRTVRWSVPALLKDLEREWDKAWE